MMKTLIGRFGRTVCWFAVGAGLPRDGFEKSRDKPAPTTGSRTSVLAALGFFASATMVAATAPEISLSLRGAGDAIVEQGEPLRIAVRIRAPRGATEMIMLAPANGTWADGVRVEIVPAAGGDGATPAEAVGKPDSPHATLDKTRIAGGLWRVSSESAQRLAPGNYVVRARLAIPDGSGWTGEVASAGTQLQIVPASNSAARETQRAVNRAHDALLAGQVESAASILDAVLKDSPDDVRLLTARAVVAARAGNVFAAMICVNRAERARPLTSKGPPPIELQELQTRLRLALGEAAKKTERPADWTWPPPNVMMLPASMLPPVTNAARAGAEAALPSKSVPAPAAVPSPNSTSAQPPPALVSAAGSAKPAATQADLSSIGSIVPAIELIDAKIIADSSGQWAASAIAGTQYGRNQYSAAQATGIPNVTVAGNSPDAWCPAVRDKGMDWLEVTFPKPVHAVEVRVRQNDAPGAVAKVEVIEPNGTTHVWWEGADPHQRTAVREIVWFAVRVPKTAYLVARVKLTLNLASGPGYKEIDAVQLVSGE